MENGIRLLRAAALVELGSLVVLLANLATAHWSAVSSLAGPVHGCAYLFVVGVAASRRPVTAGAILTALIPGVGGLLLGRRLLSTRDRGAPTSAVAVEGGGDGSGAAGAVDEPVR